MCAERLNFRPGAMDYHAMLAAEHVSRYAFATPICIGKRVLDVACGEGYGAFILARQGAADVTGVDISEAAIGVARQRFARDNVRFLIGDALDLPTLLSEQPPFDVIVGFETIEHVADAPRFLAGIQRLLAPGGVILLSCPNDGLEADRGVTNPFHVRTYTFAEFQEVTTAVLGRATRWYLGTPLDGVLVAEASSRLLSNESRDLAMLVDAQETGAASLLPAQFDHRATPETCSFYLGVWGDAGNIVLVAAPLSRKAYLDPWWALEWFKSERAQAREHVEFLEMQIGELRRASMLSKQRLHTELGRIHADRERIQAIYRSRFYRAFQFYVRVYSLPVMGPILHRLRRGAGPIVRAIVRIRRRRS